MRLCFVLPALLLGACAGFETKDDFLQDPQNMKKSVEITNKRQRGEDCDKLGQIYKFANKKNPGVSDLETIMPILGLETQDARNIDKLYKLDYSVIDKYSCTDNKSKILKEIEQYCTDKYYDEYALETLLYFPFRLVSTVSVFTIVGSIPFAMHSCGLDSAMHPIMCNKKQDCDKYLIDIAQVNKDDFSKIDKDKLKRKIKEKIQDIYPLPSVDSPIEKWFGYSELIKADNTVIGKFETEGTDVTKLHGIEILFNRCQWEIGYYSTLSIDEVLNVCACFAHNVYKNADFKNILYVYEKQEFLPSKKKEYLNEIDKCKTIIKKQTKKMEIERYGEAMPDAESDDAFGQFLIETLGNAAWAHKMVTDMRKNAE